VSGAEGKPRLPFARASFLPSLIVLVVSTIPVAGAFTLSRLFFVRDLSLAFRGRFLFLRDSLRSGVFPLWDPYPANGQAAVNDALYQLFHLPSLPIRLLLPDVVAYNTWVALPVPLAGIGAYVFLRRHVQPWAAAFGGIAYAAAGPLVASTNFPNLSWSVAAVPFVFWALDRLIARPAAATTAALAIVVALQALAGEPVTLAVTLIVAGAYAVCLDGRWRRPGVVVLAAIGEGAGVLLAAIQYVPIMAAARHSLRADSMDISFWALHPLGLIELFVPHFFGDYYNSSLRETVWMVALNSGRDPFYYSLYVGVPVVLLAAAAALSRRPQTTFWTAVIGVCAVASLGPYTPVYPFLREVIPPLRTFRFPVKYLSMSAFGIAVLAAFAVEWLIERRMPRRALIVTVAAAAVIAALAYGLVAWVVIAPDRPIRGFFHLALWAKVPRPIQGAEFVLYRARPLLTSLFLKLACFSFLLWVAASARRERRLALAVFAALAVVDLVGSNSDVNPTMKAAELAKPEWMGKLPADLHERVYVGGRLEGYINVLDVDAPKYSTVFDTVDQMRQRYMAITQSVFYPSGWKIREATTFDLPVLWSKEYSRMGGWFNVASRADRLRYLRRAGVRYTVLPTPPFPGAQPLAQQFATDQMHLYDTFPDVHRTYVVPDALVGSDVSWQIQGMFQDRFDAATGILVSDPPPPPSGTPGAPAAASAAFVEDGLNRVVVRAGLPADGYLVLLDTYDPDWHVNVDGAAAPLMRANGLFRAVHLTRGSHLVTFTYRPSAFYLGAAVSAAAALALAAAVLWERRRK
jgi:hypothetical protein